MVAVFNIDEWLKAPADDWIDLDEEQKKSSPELKSRPLTRVESLINLKALKQAFDQGEADLLAQLQRLRERILEDALNGIIELSPSDYHTLTVEPPASGRAELLVELQRIYSEGRQLVLDELEAQGAGELGDAGELDEEDRAYLEDVAGITVSRVTNDVQSRVVTIASALALAGIVGAALYDLIRSNMAETSTAYLNPAASGADHAVLSAGRAAEAEANRNLIGEVYYSCVLDENSCAVCSAADGETGATDADISPAPNPECAGTAARCRCIHVYVYAGEAKSRPYRHRERRHGLSDRRVRHVSRFPDRRRGRRDRRRYANPFRRRNRYGRGRWRHLGQEWGQEEKQGNPYHDELGRFTNAEGATDSLLNYALPSASVVTPTGQELAIPSINWSFVAKAYEPVLNAVEKILPILDSPELWGQLMEHAINALTSPAAEGAMSMLLKSSAQDELKKLTHQLNDAIKDKDLIRAAPLAERLLIFAYRCEANLQDEQYRPFVDQLVSSTEALVTSFGEDITKLKALALKQVE